MYARMPFWKRDAGALIAAPDLRELALGQHGGCLAADGRGANGGCSADSRRCRETFRERSELEGVMPPSRYKRLEPNIALPEIYPLCLYRQSQWGAAPLRLRTFWAGIYWVPQEGRALKSPF